MKLLRARLNNFGIYSGDIIIDFVSSNNTARAPEVVLFMGNNGSGKTTLFEAISLCILGPFFSGKKMPSKDYRNHLMNRIHADSSKRNTTAQIKTRFSYTEAGRTYQIEVSRSWSIRKDTISENLQVCVIDESGHMDFITNPQEFLLNLYPIGLSQLVFFDGEKIKEFAETSNSHALLKDGFHAITGIDLVKRARKDVSLYLSSLDKTKSSSLQKEYQQVVSEIGLISQKIEHTKELIKSIKLGLSDSLKKISEIEQRLAREGSGFAKDRQKKIRIVTQLEHQIESIKKDIAGLAEGILPFSFCPTLSKKLKTQLRNELDFLAFQDRKEAIQDVRGVLASAFSNASIWDIEIDEERRTNIYTRINHILESMLTTPESISEIRHNLSKSERYLFIRLIDDLQDFGSTKLQELVNELNEKTEILVKTKSDLERVPADEVVRPLIEELNARSRKLSRQELKLESLHELVKLLEQSIEIKEREKAKILEQIRKESSETRKAGLAGNAIEVLQEFEDYLLQRRIKELESVFKVVFNNLRPPSKQIERVDIDAENLTANLYRNNTDYTASSMLSAGEKQLYAVALLLSILRLSNRSFPLLVDTPLARLDRKHRKSVIENLLSLSCDQLILFATNTEMTKSIRETIAPHIIQEYKIRFNGKKGSSSLVVTTGVST